MRISYITSYNILDFANWTAKKISLNGVGYYLAKSLESQYTSLQYIESNGKQPIVSCYIQGESWR